MTIERAFDNVKRQIAGREYAAFFERWSLRLMIEQRIVYTRMGRNWRAYE